MKTHTEALRRSFHRLIDNSRAPRRRDILQWAVEELIVPNGPADGRFKLDTQPWMTLYLKEIAKDKYTTYALTGPAQNGKSLGGFVIPCLYHVFECREVVILGVPDGEMIADKWEKDLLPVIESSRYAKYKPSIGKGSKGGISRSIMFENGGGIRFMTAGGGDKSRSGYTARVLVVTEVDGFDLVGKTSRESSKLSQLYDRTQAFGHRRRHYLECTVSTEEGAIWQTITKGTHSGLFLPCHACGEYVQPDREHLQGWRDGKNEIDAGAKSYLVCPACQAHWNEEHRQDANRRAVLAGAGQSVTRDGVVVGECKVTDTFGLRVTGANNMFIDIAALGTREYKAMHSINEEDEDKSIKQKVWTIPIEPSAEAGAVLTVDGIMSRQCPLEHCQVPDDVLDITVGIDVGKHKLEYTTKAFSESGPAYTIDYGVVDVLANLMEPKQAIRQSLRILFERLRKGGDDLSPPYTRQGEIIEPSICLVDSGYETETIYEACAEENFRATSEGGKPWVFPSKGLGWRSDSNLSYRAPKEKSKTIRSIGDGWHVAKIRGGVLLVEASADTWKSRVHARWEMERDKPGAILLFREKFPKQHFKYARHQLAEMKYTDFQNGKLITRWHKTRENHWLDTEALANVGGDVLGISFSKQPAPAPAHQTSERQSEPKRFLRKTGDSFVRKSS